MLPPNVIDHYYLGGERLAALRRVPLPSPRRPEEWLAATVHRAGEPDVGRSRLADGSLFADAVAADPVGWTGTADAPAGPADVGLLVKLLDAGQRLPVHVHPTRPFARDHLHSCYGKTEAWYVLETHGEDPAVWVGFREDVDPALLAEKVDAQDSAWMLEHLNKINVRPGDGILVPAGQAHATGAGVFLVEVQEPTDFSILLEWSVTTATRDESHLGLGFDVVLPAVSHEALPAPEPVHVGLDARAAELLRGLPPRQPTRSSASTSPQATPWRFRTVSPSRSCWKTASLEWADGGLPLTRGDVLAVPDGLGDWAVTGRVVVCRPSATWPEVV